MTAVQGAYSLKPNRRPEAAISLGCRSYFVTLEIPLCSCILPEYFCLMEAQSKNFQRPSSNIMSSAEERTVRRMLSMPMGVVQRIPDHAQTFSITSSQEAGIEDHRVIVPYGMKDTVVFASSYPQT
jgi:hypothetical protein